MRPTKNKNTAIKEQALLTAVLFGVYAILAMWILFAHWPAPAPAAVVVPPASFAPCPSPATMPATIIPASTPATVVPPPIG